MTIGPQFEGQNKWQNGFLGRDGAIYAIPCDADAVLRIEPSTGQVTTLGGGLLGSGKDKWEGGVEGLDGAMYCLPQQSQVVLRIDPASAAAAAVRGDVGGE